MFGRYNQNRTSSYVEDPLKAKIIDGSLLYITELRTENYQKYS